MPPTNIPLAFRTEPATGRRLLFEQIGCRMAEQLAILSALVRLPLHERRACAFAAAQLAAHGRPTSGASVRPGEVKPRQSSVAAPGQQHRSASPRPVIVTLPLVRFTHDPALALTGAPRCPVADRHRRKPTTGDQRTDNH